MRAYRLNGTSTTQQEIWCLEMFRVVFHPWVVSIRVQWKVCVDKLGIANCLDLKCEVTLTSQMNTFSMMCFAGIMWILQSTGTTC